jgi:hypothetical protein
MPTIRHLASITASESLSQRIPAILSRSTVIAPLSELSATPHDSQICSDSGANFLNFPTQPNTTYLQKKNLLLDLILSTLIEACGPNGLKNPNAITQRHNHQSKKPWEDQDQEDKNQPRETAVVDTKEAQDA